MTTSDLITLTKQHVGFRTSATIDDDWYLERVNSAYTRLTLFQGEVASPGRQPQMRILRFPNLHSIIDSTINPSTYSINFQPFPTGTHSLISLYDLTNNREIKRSNARAIMNRNPTQAGESIRMWAPWSALGDYATNVSNTSGYIYWPTPTANVSVREYVYMRPQTLTTTVDPEIESDWHNAIHLAAGAEAATLLGMPDDAARLEASFLAFIARHRTPQEEPRSMGGLRHIFIGGRSS